VGQYSIGADRQPQLYGLFRSAKEAKDALQSVAKEQQLCMVALGLEKGNVGKPCFARQLKRCRGTCCGDESLMQHRLRLMDALGKLRLKVWPFDGPALIREGQSVHVLDAWCHLGTADSEAGVASLLPLGKPTFDQDTYRILLKHLNKMEPLATWAAQ
jgi:DNA polymerase-3 subunit epsilon